MNYHLTKHFEVMSLAVKDYIVCIITTFLIILFAYTGISKLLDYNLFKEQIAESPILVSFLKYIALSIPWIEFIVVLLLLIPRWRLKGLYSSVLIMTTFTAYVIAILLFNHKLPCSCGGIMQELSWRMHLVLNILFTGLSVVGSVYQRKLIDSKRFEKESPSTIESQFQNV